MRPALGLAGGEHSSPPARAFRGRVVEGRAMGWGSEVDSKDHEISAGARPPAPARRRGHSPLTRPRQVFVVWKFG